MDSKPQLTENEIMCRNLMERNGEIDGLRKWAARQAVKCRSKGAWKEAMRLLREAVYA